MSSGGGARHSKGTTNASVPPLASALGGPSRWHSIQTLEAKPWRSAMVWALVCAAAMAAPGSLGWGWSLTLGLAVALLTHLGFQILLHGVGLLSFGHALYLGLGAWLMALVMRAGVVTHLPWLVWPWLVGLATAALVWLLAPLQARRGGVAFAMISLGLAEAAAQVVVMLPGWFGGDAGWSLSRSGTAGSVAAGGASASTVALAAAGSAALAMAVVRWSVSGHRARVWQAQASDDERLEALGLSAFQVRRAALSWAAGPLGMAGAWLVWWSERFSVEWWSAGRSAELLVIGVLGAALASRLAPLWAWKTGGPSGATSPAPVEHLRPWSLGMATLAGALIQIWADQLGPAWSESWGLWLGGAFAWAVWQGRDQLVGQGARSTRSVEGARWEEVCSRWAASAITGGAVALGLAVLTHALWQWRWSAQADPLLRLMGAAWPLGQVDVWVGLLGSTLLCLSLALACRRQMTVLQDRSSSDSEPSKVGEPSALPDWAPSGGVASGSEFGKPSLLAKSEPPSGAVAAVILSIRGLHVRRGRQMVLQGVDLDLHDGEILALIGPNGAGKTTLLEALSGRITTSAGEVRLGGRSLIGWPVAQRARAGLARSFQGARVFEGLTVREHLALAAGSGADGASSVALQQAHGLGLSACLDTAAGELGPESLRCLELAMTLALPGRVLLLDEPTAGLGPESAERVLRLLGQVLTGRTALIIEHDLDVVRRLCVRVAVLADGQILASGPPDAVLRDPQVLARYGDEAAPRRPLHSPPMDSSDAVDAFALSPVALHVENLTVARQGRPGGRAVSFRLREGEVLAVLGPMGSGRSSLLKALMGLTPCEGRVTVAGSEAGRVGATDRARLGMAWVAEDRGLVADLSVLDHLRLAWWGRSTSADGLPKALERVWLRFPRLKARQALAAGNLSGGERQMLALARCWLVQPRILLLDEPSEGLSPQALNEAQQVLSDLAAQGTAIVITEHRPVLSLRLASRALHLHRGEVQRIGALHPDVAGRPVSAQGH